MLLGPERVFRLTNVKCRSLWFSSSTIIISLRRFFLLSIAVLIISYLHTNICTLGGRKSIPKGLKHTAWPRAFRTAQRISATLFPFLHPLYPYPYPYPFSSSGELLPPLHFSSSSSSGLFVVVGRCFVSKLKCIWGPGKHSAQKIRSEIKGLLIDHGCTSDLKLWKVFLANGPYFENHC